VQVVLATSRHWDDVTSIYDRLRDLPEGASVVVDDGPLGHDIAANAERIGLGVQVLRVGEEHLHEAILDGVRPDVILAYRLAGTSPGTDSLARAAEARGVLVERHGEGWS
jgi:hypothetical protein